MSSVNSDRSFCACTTGCLLSKTEARRAGVECRYKDGKVRPVSRATIQAAVHAGALSPDALDEDQRKPPCLYPLPDGRRCCECDACQVGLRP